MDHEMWIENEWLNGSYKQPIPQKNAVEVFRGDAAAAVVLEDPTDTWSHGITKFEGDVSGEFTAVSVRRQGRSRSMSAVGISCGGPLNSREGLILSPPNLQNWDRIQVCAPFRERFGVPSGLQNDANACALAEWNWDKSGIKRPCRRRCTR